MDSGYSEYEKFLKKRDRILDQKYDAEKKLYAAIDAYEAMLASDIRHKELKLEYERNKVNLRENTLSLIENQLHFMRPNIERDVIYRQLWYEHFPEEVAKIVPDDLPLRFHGCPIYAARDILNSGEISSSVDRIGVATSYDGAGQISVTTKDNIATTVHSYTDLTDDFDMPAGCIFVVTPSCLADEECGDSLLMGNVCFRNDPDRFVAVISTPENMANLSAWLTASGFPSSKAYTFDEFIDYFHEVEHSVHIPYLQEKKKPRLDSVVLAAEKRANEKMIGTDQQKKFALRGFQPFVWDDHSQGR